MATLLRGMDTAAGHAAAATLQQGAADLESVAARLDAALAGFTWTGDDAERVRGEWAFTRRPQIVLAAEHLADLATRLEAEARAQDEASGAGAGAGTGGTAGAPGAAGGTPGADGRVPASAPGLLDRIGAWIGDRLTAGGAALGRFLGAGADLQGKILDVLTGERDWSAAAIAASALGAAGAGAGVVANLVTGEDQRWFAEGVGGIGDPVAVPLVETGLGDRVALEQPRSLDTIMQSVTDAYANGTADGSDGEVRIVRVDNGAGTPAYIVAVPGTETWSPGGGSAPRDLTANVALMAGNPTAAAESVRLAMERADIPADAPVLLVGHSQGGMITGHLAADEAFRERFNVTNMVTYGSPVDHLQVSGVNVLQMGHSFDPTPRLDLGGAGLPSPTGGQQVELPSPGSWYDVVGNHSHEAYIRSVHDALGAEGALGDRLRAYQSDASMLPFLVGPNGSATGVDVPVHRVPAGT
ncbi:hypothetical protein RDV89_16840 [Nocardioides zeae]|uniref:PGAP1-like protein n=1 Tax=Nocardioides imazamoxiresistens TaxID=3231893 RepID=A0ABU3Q0W9_9ACTN|nr:hypothetical protein [Nocardioides zeae]MDT9594756.1 hypothetical protein [Nocardioides zeae]